MEPNRDDKARKNAPKDNQAPPTEDGGFPASADQPINAESSGAESPVQQNFARHDDDASSTSQVIGNGGELLRDDRPALREGSPSVADVPLPDLTDLSHPVFAFEASTSAPDDPEGSFSTDTTGNGLSEEKANELIKLIEDGLAAKEASPETVSPDKLEGIVLRVVKGADSTASDVSDAAATPDSNRQEPRASRVDEASSDIDRFAGGLFRRPEPAGDALAGADDGSALPRIIIMVELANARAIMEEDRRETAEEMAAMQHEIAAAEVKHAFWEYENQRRAADYRLRGPSW